MPSLRRVFSAKLKRRMRRGSRGMGTDFNSGMPMSEELIVADRANEPVFPIPDPRDLEREFEDEHQVQNFSLSSQPTPSRINGRSVPLLTQPPRYSSTESLTPPPSYTSRSNTPTAQPILWSLAQIEPRRWNFTFALGTLGGLTTIVFWWLLRALLFVLLSLLPHAIFWGDVFFFEVLEIVIKCSSSASD